MMSSSNSSNKRKYSGAKQTVFLCVLHELTVLVYILKMMRSVTRLLHVKRYEVPYTGTQDSRNSLQVVDIVCV
jgi:hypothetical protein